MNPGAGEEQGGEQGGGAGGRRSTHHVHGPTRSGDVIVQKKIDWTHVLIFYLPS